MALQLSILNATLVTYFRHVLDTAGYNAVTVHKDEEPTGTSLPFVRFSFDDTDLTPSKTTDRNPDNNLYRAFLSVSIFGSLDGNGKQESEAIGSVLQDGFIAADINFKVSSRLIDRLRTIPKKENEQTNHLAFSADVFIYYP